jgi:6-phosphofructokinase
LVARTIGILTAGGDSPGLNAAIRAVGKAAQRAYGMDVIGFKDGFLGLMHDRYEKLRTSDLSGILTRGGTVLGTSRIKVDRVKTGDGKKVDARKRMREVVERHELEALVCLGGDGTVKNALKLSDVGVPVLTLPKTIDNDVAETDITFGFDTAMYIAAEAIDRLHSTAHSHHRIMVGLASGADVILIPEIPYDVEAIASSISARRAAGSTFSIVAVAEGAISKDDATIRDSMEAQMNVVDNHERKAIKKKMKEFEAARAGGSGQLASTLSGLTGLESRITILGHVQRGGTPTPADRLLATRLGTACADYIAEGTHGVLVAARGERTEAVPLKKVAGRTKQIPLDHPWVETARHLGIALGD